LQVGKIAEEKHLLELLEFSSQVWSPHYKHLIDKIESVQRFLLENYLASVSCHIYLVYEYWM